MTSTGSTAAPEPAAQGALWRAFCPAYVAASVCEIDPAWLEARGIRALILDLDNTLVTWHSEEVEAEIGAWVERLLAGGFRLCIASNTHRPRRLARLAERLGVPFASGVAKPRRGGMRRAMALMDARPEETAVVGDQVLTDVLAGNRCGLLTILVTPISPREFAGTRLVSRRIERWLLQRFAARNWLRSLPGDVHRRDAETQRE